MHNATLVIACVELLEAEFLSIGLIPMVLEEHDQCAAIYAEELRM
jgi:hypothetical protein